MGERVDDRLPPEERRAFEALPRERMPGPWVEERTIQALRDRGLVRGRPFVPPAWRVAAAAAALALFAGGVTLGQWLGVRQGAETFMALQRDDALATALEVQQAGSAYVSALASLVERTDRTDAATVAQVREVALAALWGAAWEIVRLAPDDPVAGQILRGFEATPQAAGVQREEARHVIWF
jgi:hypothetical protein